MSFSKACLASIRRTVPLRDRMTNESVMAPSSRYRTPLSTP